jgi:hypothetical protein
MIKCLILVLILTFLGLAQNDNTKEIVARAGGIEITSSEFQERFHLTPQLEMHRKAQVEANKKIFLYGLLAEKLLALEAVEMGLDTAETVRFFLKNFEKMFVRDALYRKEIKQRSRDYAENLLSFYLENSSRIFTKSIILKDEEEINRIYSLLQKGVAFDDVYSEMTPQERDTITLFAGTIDNRTEDELFRLPEKSFSKPLRYNEHWVIFYIEHKSDPVMAQAMGWETEYKRLEKAARDKAELIYYKEYMERFFPEKKVDASGVLIHALAVRINHILDEKGKKENDDYYLSTTEIIQITRNYSRDSLDAVLVKLDGTDLSLLDFLMWLRTENYVLKDNTHRNAVSLLNGKVKKFIEYELLAKEGYNQGLDKSESVIKYTNLWRDNYLYQLRLTALSDSLLPSVDNHEVIKIAEIVNNDLEVMEQCA